MLRFGASVLCFLGVAGLATPVQVAGREVIVLVAPDAKAAVRTQSVYTATAAILHHLGLITRYHSVSDAPPSFADAREARGVIVLVEGNAARDATAYDRWLTAWLDSGRPVFLLAGPAVLQANANGQRAADELWQGILSRLGMHRTAANEFPLHSTVLPGPHAEFECGFKPPPGFAPYESTDARNQVFLREQGDLGTMADLGVVGPRGAFASSQACLFETSPLTYRLRWRVDPFWLLAGLRAVGEPALDTTTSNGRRIFYAHIDGDGFSNKAQVRGGGYAAEIIRDRVLAKTWLPTTASVIVREVAGHPDLEAIARSIFRMPNVQAASHTYTHPFDWVKGVVPNLGSTSDAADGAIDAPHAPITPSHEIDDSIRYVGQLLPKGKAVEALLWSGAANPPAAYLARTRKVGIASLNGGGTTLDQTFPSYANLMPPALAVGPEWQVFASCGNENVFTNLWSGPFDGQLKALDLYRFSESPRRMLPVNLYYHFYSGERTLSCNTLQRLYRWAEQQPLCHMTVASYCRVVQGFLGAQVTGDGAGNWQVAGAGACQTLRFDDEPGGVDLDKSRGVAGFNHAHGALYVHLAGPDARVSLAKVATSGPYLESASARLLAWQRAPHRIAATFHGDAPVTLSLIGFQPGQRVRSEGNFRGASAADPQGRLKLAAAAGNQHLEITW